MFSVVVPTHADDDGSVVLFVGWSLSSVGFILEAADVSVLSSLVTSVTLTNADVTVYAVWGYDRNDNGTPDVLDDLFSVTYDVNGGVGAPVDSNTYGVGGVVMVSYVVPTRDGYTFEGWLYAG